MRKDRPDGLSKSRNSLNLMTWPFGTQLEMPSTFNYVSPKSVGQFAFYLACQSQRSYVHQWAQSSPYETARRDRRGSAGISLRADSSEIFGIALSIPARRDD